MPTEQKETVTYWAVSIFSSRTAWVNFAALLVAVLSETEVVQIVPARHMPTYGAVLAILNIFLRTQAQRPAAMIPPGHTKPVEVNKIGPGEPKPPKVTD